ncbi:hypothetical protein AAMO2058_000776200 [Amorphochlora amoebiformis]|uniref:Transcription elongation factor SPT5 n=1 Tax=Amorphochlora amoebiformis TaxID=1561963 RepID=A0A7S0CY46_9EUKA|mmetsp:Transcript_15660/g.24789  ORF Transcript_15660/g.24789 Transcript_15660/m.24789 type:complete len:984 (+) Transcript_15660:124-3075(+)
MSDFEGDLDERPEDEVQSHGEEGEREDDGYDEKDDREEVEGEEREGEEDEDEEREGEGGEDDDDGKGRKRRKLDRARFFEDEAEESGEDVDDRDDDEEDGGEDEYDVNDGFVDEEGVGASEVGVHHRFREEEAEAVRKEAERYAEKGEFNRLREDREAEEKRLPSVEDPKLWLVPCKIGKENEILMKIMQRYASRLRGPVKGHLQILSCFTTPASKGFIYIEAWKEDAVRHALDNIGQYRIQLYKSQLVPINEMVHAVSIKETVHKLRVKQWVRLKSGIYKGDLAQIYKVEEETVVWVKVIPRIDFVAAQTGEKRSRPGARPQAALLDRAMREKHGLDDNSGEVERRQEDGKFITVWKNKRFNDSGFLLKRCRVTTLQIDAVNPSLEEIERFKSKDDEDDGEEATGFSLNSKTIRFQKSDRVRVLDGDLKGLTGKVVTVIDNQVTVFPDHEKLTEPLDFNSNELAKYFENGNHVKITRGKHQGESGHVVHVDEKDDIVSVFSDVSSMLIKVFSSDLVEWSEISAGKDTLGNYRLHDMVMLGPGNFVVIIKVETNSFKVMDVNGNVSSARLQELGKKRSSRFAAAYDQNSNQVGLKDTVTVLEGQHRGTKGEIKHIQKSYLFLYNRQVRLTGGIFVVRARQTLLVGQKLQVPGGGFDAFSRRNDHQRQPRKLMIQRRRKVTNDAMLRARVKISRGKYKGHIGSVSDIMESKYRVELESIPKVISISKDWVRRLEELQDMEVEDRYYRYQGMETPLIGSRTPSRDDGGRTPMLGGMTPSYADNVPLTPGTPGRFNAAAMATPHHDDVPGDGWTPTPAPEDANTPRTPLTAPLTTVTPHTPQTYNPNSPYTPADGLPNTPGEPNTPLTPALPNTPYTSSTPLEEEEKSYIQKDIAVMYDGMNAVIREVGDNNTIAIIMDNSGRRETVSESALEIIRPSAKGDKVKVLSTGEIGELFSTSNEAEAVVQIGTDMKVVNMNGLAKYVAP